MTKVNTNKKEIENLLLKGVEEVIDFENLKKKLLSGKQLRIKFGIDPTSPDLHLGHVVPLKKLREFQKLGHKAILIIGDFTATIGDPSGRQDARKPLTEKEVKNNLKKYLTQAKKFIDLKKTEIFYNSKWFSGKNGLKNILSLAYLGSVQQVLHREDFQNRLKSGKELSIIEILYPLFQGFDSVMVKADVEIGGTDQKFNLLMGRRIQRVFNQEEQDIMTLPILEGLDGIKKMSKSYQNYIAINDLPSDVFGKIMSLNDNLIIKYFKLLTDKNLGEIQEMEKKMKNNEINPRDLKINLAFEITKMLYDSQLAKKAQENFISLFQKKELPNNLKEIKCHIGEELGKVLIKNQILKSMSEFKRLIDFNAIENFDDKIKIKDYHYQIIKDGHFKIGKKIFIKIKID